MNAIEIAVDVELQHHRRVVTGPAGIGGSNGRKAETSQVEGLDKGIDDANRIALVRPILQAFRQQRRLPAIDALDEPRHARPRRFSSRIIAETSFHTARLISGHSRPFSKVRNLMYGSF